ncbi:MAG: hypothetical protein O2779_03395 [Nanoarchaeota archaeon]|nr:hypothetical protein [Nanoarchaeota archaeon]
MAEIEHFLQYLQEQFRELEVLLRKILKEEKSVHDEILMKKGFIIHSYSLNYSSVNLDVLSEILAELENVLKREVQLCEELEKHTVALNDIERFAKQKLHTDLLAKYLKEALYYCELMITRIKQLKAMLQDGQKLHKNSLPRQTEMFFNSFENVGTKILKFVRFLEQYTQNIIKSEKDIYYSEPRTYGRAMASREYKKTLSKKKLSSSKDPTYVFDAPKHVIKKINSMSKDTRSQYFKLIGVEQASYVVYFQTKLKPSNHDSPIPQSNGLLQYSFPKGLEVEILAAA